MWAKPVPLAAQSTISTNSAVCTNVKFINANLVEATSRHPISNAQTRRINPRFFANENGVENAKDNHHCACCSANCCINGASGGCFRTPPHTNEGPRGGKRAIPEQQCLCCAG